MTRSTLFKQASRLLSGCYLNRSEWVVTASEMRGRFTSLFTIYLGPSSPPPRMASIQGPILIVSSSLEIAAQTAVCVGPL